ncbi:uncharacterized protein LOC117527254 [Thalassophryne amazonica]|uniref:uncharacterized protein LOC117527254 n=1 Tax=Thalassophryne amazonica TaxID=390379 RepID=UPI001472142C|nr:uncharacterized protein LOC117527254 [Thalassophryne amazonica]
MAARRRSVVWNFFRTIDDESLLCMLCRRTLANQNNTSSMLRHLRVRHPSEFAGTLKTEQPSTGGNGHHGMEAAGSDHYYAVEVALEDRDTEAITSVSEGITTVSEAADIASAVNGILEIAQEVSVNHDDGGGVGGAANSPRKRSLIWKYYETMEGLDAVRCRLCMKKLQYVRGSTSNLRRHIAKRHSEVVSELVNEVANPPRSSMVPGSSSTSVTPMSVDSREHSPDGLRTNDGEKRVMTREMELVEALRRAQKEEAKALEHQRELLEMLRAANARDVAAEKMQTSR